MYDIVVSETHERITDMDYFSPSIGHNAAADGVDRHCRCINQHDVTLASL